MNVGVLLHIRLLMEALPTVLAGIRPGVRVDQQVSRQGGRSLEGLSAHFALKAFLLGIRTAMEWWGAGGGKGGLRKRTLQQESPPPWREESNCGDHDEFHRRRMEAGNQVLQSRKPFLSPHPTLKKLLLILRPYNEGTLVLSGLVCFPGDFS